MKRGTLFRLAFQTLRKIFDFEFESFRRCAIMNGNQLDRLISEMLQPKAEFEERKFLIDELEQKRQIDAEYEGQEERR